MGYRDRLLEGLPRILNPKTPETTRATSEDIAEAERAALEAQDEPEPDDWPKLPRAALHGLAGDVVRTINPHTEADPAAVLAHFLVFFGNCVGPSPYFQVDADQHRAKLFTALVGSSSTGRKGTSEGQIRRIFDNVDPAWSKNRIIHGLASGEGLIQALMPQGGSSDPRLLAIEPEMANVLKAMQREGSILSGIIRQAWDRGELSHQTKKNPLVVKDTHVSMVTHVTQPELLTTMDSSSRSNGFANRFIWILVKRSKFLADAFPVPDADLQGLYNRTSRAIDSARRTAEMRRDPEAAALWREVYHELSRERSGLAGMVTSRAQVQVLRVAMIYALLDSSHEVRKPHLEAALALWRFSEACVTRIFSGRIGNPIADRIWREIRDQREVTQTAVSEIFARNVSAVVLETAINLLEDDGYIRRDRRPQPAGKKGRPIEVYVVLK